MSRGAQSSAVSSAQRECSDGVPSSESPGVSPIQCIPSSDNFNGLHGSHNGSSDDLAAKEKKSAVSLSPSSSQSSLLQMHMLLEVNAAAAGAEVDGPAENGASTPDVDDTILEALRSKDRLFVLKLGEQMEALIKERHSRTKYSVTTETTYQRLLVHRCAAYYKLTPETDSFTKGISVLIAVDSKIPPRRISELVPVEVAAQPTFQIMRRSGNERRRQKSNFSHPGSAVGEDGEMSDVDPSETGSMGSRSTASKTRKTMEERAAEYQEARTRIWMNFNESDKNKERSASASSSSLSLAPVSEANSPNGTGDGGSSVDGDVDDGVSSVATESEWSVPVTEDRVRGGENSAYPYRSGSIPYIAHGGSTSSSGRASPSSSFSFPSLADPSAGGAVYGYDQASTYPPPQSGFFPQYPMFPYSPPAPGQPFPPPSSTPFPYYAPYPYPPPPPPPPSQHHSVHQPNSDPTSPVTGPVDGYPHPAPVMPYNGYMWHQSPPNQMHQGNPVYISSPQQPHPQAENHIPPPAQGPPVQMHPGPPMMYGHPQYPGFVPGPAPYGPYPMQPYYPTPISPPVAHPQSQPIPPVDLPRTNGSGSEKGNSSGSNSPTFSRKSSGFSASHPGGNSNGNGRGGPHPPSSRAHWSFGPGVGSSGSPHPNSPGSGFLYGQGGMGGETVGPRLSSSMRRTSGASSGSSGYRTPGDETGSATSSSASSTSSRRTYMSTPPKHPLPPRPDWAAGLRPQPTLANSRSRHYDSNNSSRNMSPAHSSVMLPPVPPQPQGPSHQAPAQLTPIILQSNDFPPLSKQPTDAKRTTVGGAWTTPITARTILKPKHENASNGNQSSQRHGSALFNHGQGHRGDDDERAFERPPPKDGAELFNPKGGKRASGSGAQDKASEDDRKCDGQVPGVGLINGVAALSIGDQLKGKASDDGSSGCESPRASLPQNAGAPAGLLPSPL